MGIIKRVSNIRAVFFACLGLGLLTLAVYFPVGNFEFQSYDDQRYVAANPIIKAGLTRQGVEWAFGFHVSNWHPLTWISHMLDAQLFGMNAGAHHLVNLSLHVANIILLLLVLNRMTRALCPSAVVAALFALHPMHVESEAWVAERKDVLSTFFFMLTLWAYTSYAESKVHPPEPSAQEGRAVRNYVLAILFFTLGLLSKPMLVTLPIVLLLLDYWPLQRVPTKNAKTEFKCVLPLLWEKVPFLLLAMGSSVLTFLAQKSGGAVASLELFSFEARIANACVAYLGYLGKLFWPMDLAVIYLPPVRWPVWRLITAVVVLAGVSALAVWQRFRRPYIIVGWLWFLGTLVPVIGLVQVGSQYMADRYSYVPFIGCFISLAWAGWDFLSSQRGHLESAQGIFSKQRPAFNLIAGGVFWAGPVLLIGTAAAVTRNQLEYWRTPESLFRHCIQATTDNYIAYNNLGAILVNRGKYDEAGPFYAEALRINAGFAETWMNMGTLLAIQGDATNAVEYLQQSVRLAPGCAECYGKLAVTLSQLGRIADAVSAYRESLGLAPDQVAACNNLAWILATHPDSQLRNGPEAVQLAEHACLLTDYKQPLLVGTLAAAYAEAGRFSEAAAMADKAIELANEAGQKEIVRKNRELKALYDARQPYREAP